MRVIRKLATLPANAKQSVLALGNFDGLHLGHHAVLDEARHVAHADGKPLAVMSFEPHPRRLFHPELPPLRLFPLRDKIRLLREAEVDFLFLLRFDLAFSKLSAQAFCDAVLVEAMGVHHVVTGSNFLFGHKRSGNEDTLEKHPGFGYSAVTPITIDNAVCSSTRIRDALHLGHPEAAAKLLGRPYHFTSQVHHGEKRGREFGFPTANVQPHFLFSPRYGVYAVMLSTASGQHFRAVANYGVRPMYPLQEPLWEVHCLDAPKDLNLYGQRVTVHLHRYLREERQFADPDLLITQIQEDEKLARRELANVSF